jgi:hypoxanthine phosphoribosyltransferase
MIIEIKDLRFKELISAATIAEKVKEMGAAIQDDYGGKKPLMIGVLNGAFVFAADLMRACAPMPCEITFTKLSSYKGTESTGTLESVIGLDFEIEGRHIILLEDIVDTGFTLSTYISQLRFFNPASIAIAALLVKPDALNFPLDIKYRCFDIPKAFVVGYGLDYDGEGRQFDSIYQLYEG